MSLPSYLSVTGERQGLISQGASTPDSVGNLWQEGFEDQILVLAGEHHMQVPVSSQTTAPTGMDSWNDKYDD